MDDRRFDAWTRALVLAPHSRRGVLRLLAGAAAGATFGRAGGTAAASGCGVAITPVAANSRAGACKDLGAYRVETGVTNDKGKSYPGAAGATAASFTHPPVAYQGTPHRKEGKVCVKTDPIRVTFAAEPRVFRLDWQPPAGASAECRAAAAAWAARVEEHECHHVQDARQVAEQGSRDWGARTYEECGKDKEEAVAKIGPRIQQDLDDAIAEMANRFDRLTKKFHRTPEGRPLIDPDCSKCEECQATGARAGKRAGAAGVDQCCPTEWCGEDGRWCCPADRPYCCQGGCWQEGSIDCGPYCCPPRTTCCGPTQRCCAEGFVCKSGCSTNPPFACCRAGATSCCPEGQIVGG
jgi:hypothetical protein